MKRSILSIFSILLVNVIYSQTSIDVYPTHWWVGMKNPNVQLMVHAKDIGTASTATINYPGIRVRKVHQVENKNYLFIDITIAAGSKPGTAQVKLNNGRSFSYEIKARRVGNGTTYAQGVNATDFVYLLMPDRFSNGDYANDRIPGMKDQSLDRDSIFLRHGGDIQGVINHLDYLQDLGVTTLWMTPVLENDMPNRTEHGYAATNTYKVDPRLGGDTAYKRLSHELHRRGMKLLQDVVYNHCGLYNFLMQDQPMKDWFHQWPKFTHPNYKDQTEFDPHGAAIDKKLQTDAWFVPTMPDFNQSNPYVANFLIQNSIWCIEEFGVDGWRIDTYIYVDQDFMNRCNQALIDEYPKMTMVGEVWVNGTVNEAFFTRNNLNVPFKSNATGVLDFQCLFNGIQPALQHHDGFEHLYETISNDLLYKDPMNNMIFLDNHDMSRFLSQVNDDVDLLKMGIGWLLTERGTPQLYYGTEILLKGIANPDGRVRQDFPGGWKEDRENKFLSSGRNEKENEVFSWTRTIAHFRKQSSAIRYGKLMQYVPENQVYTYFRYDDKETVMIVMNGAGDERTIDVSRFAERTSGYSSATNIVTQEHHNLNGTWKIPAKTIWILKLSN
jgi:neopullulanase